MIPLSTACLILVIKVSLMMNEKLMRYISVLAFLRISSRAAADCLVVKTIAILGFLI